MFFIDKKIEKEKGAILTMVLVFSSIFTLILAGLLGYILIQFRNSERLVAKEQAFHIAESGIEYYKWYLAHELEGL